ncbi:MAG: pilus assembly protein PilM [Clostridiales bacterium]|jgi:type IV pilus assembly protein PilM|nr:pilus assembly protein PilM [Clostridiales bacterium]
MFQKLGAIDVGSCNIKMARGRRLIRGAICDGVSLIHTPDGMAPNGLITQPKELAAALEEPVREMRDYSAEIVMIAASDKVLARRMFLPNVTRSASRTIGGLVRDAAEREFAIESDDYTIDYKVIGEAVKNAEKSVKGIFVMTVAVPNDIIRSYSEFLRECGLSCRSIDFSGNALVKQVLSEGAGRAGRSMAVVDIGHKATSVAIASNGKFQYYRAFPYGGEAMTLAIADRLKCSVEQAEDMKKKYGIMPCDEVGFAGQCVDVSHAVKAVLSRLAGEISEFFDFYVERNADNPLERITLSGGGAMVKNLDEFMVKIYNIPISKRTRVGSMGRGKDTNNEIGMYFTSCLGALKTI